MFSLITKIGKTVYKKYSESSERTTKLKTMKAEGKFKIEEAKIGFRLAKLNAESQRIKRESEMDMTYDLIALKQKKYTWADEFILVSFFSILLLTFIPYTQDAMSIGWVALNEAPWWFEFGLVGMLVSTFGLKGVLREFLNSNPLKKKPKN